MSSVWIRLWSASGPALADEQHRDDHGRQCREAQRHPSVQALADGVGRDEDAQPDLEGAPAGMTAIWTMVAREHHEHHYQRIAAAPHERQALEEQQDDGQPAGGRHVRRSREEGQERQRGEPEGDRHVDRMDVGGQRAQDSCHGGTIPPAAEPEHPSMG